MKSHVVPAFAALGHQESWEKIAAIVRAMRPPPHLPLSDVELREVVPWIPPRTVSRLRVSPTPDAETVPGVYIDTFITPDELAQRPTRRILGKVRDGLRAAEREGARLVTLGGFTSILFDGIGFTPHEDIVVTTGNTLTAALIVRGVERAASLLGRRLAEETLLIIGATGDIGSACGLCFAGRTRHLLLSARNRERLEAAALRLGTMGPVTASTEVRALMPTATIVIAVTSTPVPCFALEELHPEALVCDAGYPKNIHFEAGDEGRRRVFWGGMGTLGGQFCSDDGILEQFYRFPSGNVAHGCMLEGMVLAMSRRFEPFSSGRGHITPARMEEMWRLAAASGVNLAPLFDHAGLWPEVIA